ncbi:MAG TPA: hypothetical protein PK765_01730 [bacterium]|nr:hypothetical protein [bacterium]
MIPIYSGNNEVVWDFRLQSLSVDFGSADDPNIPSTEESGIAESNVERVCNDDSFIGVGCISGHDHVDAVWQGSADPCNDRIERLASHHDHASFGQFLEPLEIGGNVPWKFPRSPDQVVAVHGNDEGDRHAKISVNADRTRVR